MARYNCGNEVKVNDIVKCVADFAYNDFPGKKSEYYRVSWNRGGPNGSSRDITLEGHEKMGHPPDCVRFALVLRDGKKAPSPAKPPFQIGDIVRDKFNTASEFMVTFCGLDKDVDWRVNLVGQTGSKPVRQDELAGYYEAKPPQPAPLSPHPYKIGDFVLYNGARWQVSSTQSTLHGASPAWHLCGLRNSNCFVVGVNVDDLAPAVDPEPKFTVGAFVRSPFNTTTLFKVTSRSFNGWQWTYDVSSQNTIFSRHIMEESQLMPVTVDNVTGVTDYCIIRGVDPRLAVDIGVRAQQIRDAKVKSATDDLTTKIKELLK